MRSEMKNNFQIWPKKAWPPLGVCKTVGSRYPENQGQSGIFPDIETQDRGKNAKFWGFLTKFLVFFNFLSKFEADFGDRCDYYKSVEIFFSKRVPPQHTHILGRGSNEEPGLVSQLSKAVFLNRRDASRYRDLETFLPGLEIFLKLQQCRIYFY